MPPQIRGALPRVLTLSGRSPFRHVCVVMRGRKCLARGEASLAGKLRFPGARRGFTCHAEMNAVKMLLRTMKCRPKKRRPKKCRPKKRRPMKCRRSRFHRYIVWVVRFRRDGRLAHSKPCETCRRLLVRLGFSTVKYSTQAGAIITARLSELASTYSSGFRCANKSYL